MICRSRKAFFCLALSFFMTAAVQAGQDAAVRKVDATKTKVVKQADGLEVIRLVVASTREHCQELWAEAGMAPRLMTALATLPGTLRGQGQSLPEAVDPSLVRSWAEFVDPSLALMWKTYAQINGFSKALLRRAGEGLKGPSLGGAGQSSSKVPWVNTAVGTPSGQRALQEWLMLPMPEPKSNPWLSNLGNYRY